MRGRCCDGGGTAANARRRHRGPLWRGWCGSGVTSGANAAADSCCSGWVDRATEAAAAAASAPLRHTLRVASYNIDGLCQHHVVARARAAAAAIAALDPPPDIVMLQEVTEANEAVFESLAAARGMRMMTGGAVCGLYYAALLVSQRLGDIRLRVAPFPTSRMGRHWIAATITPADDDDDDDASGSGEAEAAGGDCHGGGDDVIVIDGDEDEGGGVASAASAAAAPARTAMPADPREAAAAAAKRRRLEAAGGSGAAPPLPPPPPPTDDDIIVVSASPTITTKHERGGGGGGGKGVGLAPLRLDGGVAVATPELTAALALPPPAVTAAARRTYLDPRCLPITVFTSHLESTVPEERERVAQFRRVIDLMRAAATGTAITGSGAASPPSQMVLFGGDTNLRDSEVGALPASIGAVDVWEAVGSHPDTRFTWDTHLNGNVGFRGPRCRYDRLFCVAAPAAAAAAAVASSSGPSSGSSSSRSSGACKWRPAGFALFGTAQVPSLRMHPSDHFGIVADFVWGPGTSV